MDSGNTAADADIRHLRRTSSPLRLARLLTPHIFGHKTQFRADPWLQMSERQVMSSIANKEDQTFDKINAPSQIGKSTFIEVYTPLWALGHWPDTRIILIGYSDDLAGRSGSLVRDIFHKWGAQLFGLTVDPDYESKQEWRLAGHMGGMLSVGIGSRITGMPGDIVIIGDVIKNMEEAASKRTKDAHWNEFHGSVLTRLQPGGAMIVTHTRFAEDDLSGRIDVQTAEPGYEGDQWNTLNFKAIAEPDPEEEVEDLEAWRDLLGRRNGEPLKTRFSKPQDEDPENWPRSFFYRRRAGMLPFIFSSVYQGTPTLPKGGMFPVNKWKYYDPTPGRRPVMRLLRRVWDTAASEGGGDYTVGALVGKDADDNFYVLDLWRDRKGPDDVMTEVKASARTDGRACRILVEASRNGDGITVVAMYKRELRGYAVEAANADGSKEDRARPYSMLQQRGKVYLPRFPDGTEPEWVPEFRREHRLMMGDGRKGRHDDQIDAVAHGINDMLDAEPVQLVNAGALKLHHASGGIRDVSLEEHEVA